jgi:hypothetical protein
MYGTWRRENSLLEVAGVVRRSGVGGGGGGAACCVLVRGAICFQLVCACGWWKGDAAKTLISWCTGGDAPLSSLEDPYFGISLSSHTNEHDRLEMLDDVPSSSSIDTFEIILVYHSRASMVIYPWSKVSGSMVKHDHERERRLQIVDSMAMDW